MKSSRLFFLLILFIINCFILVWLIQDKPYLRSEQQQPVILMNSGNSFCLHLSTKSCLKHLISVIHLPNFSPQPCLMEISTPKTSLQMQCLI